MNFIFSLSQKKSIHYPVYCRSRTNLIVLDIKLIWTSQISDILVHTKKPLYTCQVAFAKYKAIWFPDFILISADFATIYMWRFISADNELATIWYVILLEELEECLPEQSDLIPASETDVWDKLKKGSALLFHFWLQRVINQEMQVTSIINIETQGTRDAFG